MFVAIMINKKGIKIKKFWRTVLVMTIAIPQFVSLLYVAKLFDSTGIIGKLIYDFLPQSMISANQQSLWQNPITAKILLIVLNIWVGIPYMLYNIRRRTIKSIAYTGEYVKVELFNIVLAPFVYYFKTCIRGFCEVIALDTPLLQNFIKP